MPRRKTGNVVQDRRPGEARIEQAAMLVPVFFEAQSFSAFYLATSQRASRPAPWGPTGLSARVSFFGSQDPRLLTLKTGVSSLYISLRAECFFPLLSNSRVTSRFSAPMASY